jgi:hypothetical protein
VSADDTAVDEELEGELDAEVDRELAGEADAALVEGSAARDAVFARVQETVRPRSRMRQAQSVPIPQPLR